MRKIQKRAQLNVGQIIVLIMGIVASIAIFGAVIDQTAIGTTKSVSADETTNLSTVDCYNPLGQVRENETTCNITVGQAPTGWKIADCPIESVTVTNATGTALTLNTDYRLTASSGIIRMLNTSATNTTGATGLADEVLISYSWCRDGYNKDTSARTIFNLVPLFAAIAILAFVAIGLKAFNGI